MKVSPPVKPKPQPHDEHWITDEISTVVVKLAPGPTPGSRT
jgi:hypothetical protein